ncbi:MULTISPECIES: hypothetical protein [unclassified Curtobacterium]|uniref:hypothetical protein n=1 Tax=unclassified Curtobacterium TaxID=257496 RepID=UPI000DA9D0F7|nr:MULTISPECIES: hypothetical protein [unclassified Curtobacterium]PZE28149.1 hypothetical protein DEI86_06095 [Curtobacterium sp. MCBD17_028]PZF62238.1 hypothetical protein DEI92_01695 [Curtobacterium sp. MCBD17_034]PZM40055.1 hypothetical protein DEI90_04410 [Curtobacterium sp. MCBD17_031]
MTTEEADDAAHTVPPVPVPGAMTAAPVGLARERSFSATFASPAGPGIASACPVAFPADGVVTGCTNAGAVCRPTVTNGTDAGTAS